jgi:hypothetical protein
MSASAVRGGQVYVEIGANPSKLLNALRIVNTQVGNLGSSMADIGTSMAAAGGAITAPIAAAAFAFAGQNAEIVKAQEALKGIGQEVGAAVAPAFAGMAKVVTGAANAVSRFIRENPKLIQQMLILGGTLTGVGATLFGVGTGLNMLTRVVGPISATLFAFAKSAMAVGASLITIATSGPVLALAAVLGGVAFAAQAAGVDMSDLAAKVGASFQGPIGQAQRLFSDLAATASTTVDGIYNAIAAGDIAAAVDILWAGVNAAWLRGQQAIMNAVDPWSSMIQNTFDFLFTNVLIGWDLLATDSSRAVRKVLAVVMGIFDELANGVMATFDTIVGEIQKAWIRITGYLTGAKDTQTKLDAIDKENQSRADQRGKDRPGLAARMNEATATNTQANKDAIDRAVTSTLNLERRMMGREDANRQRAADRAQAVADANAALQQKVGQTQAPAEIDPKASGNFTTSVAGTFSAFGLGQLGSGNIDKQQLDELKRIREELQRQARMGGIGP